MRWRRANSLWAYWDQEHLVLENYYSQQTLQADPAALRILDLCATWRRPDEIDECAAHLQDLTPGSIRTWFRRLAGHGMLLAEGGPEAKQDALLRSTWLDWLPHAGFHFATKDTPFFSTRQALKFNRALLAKSPPPRPFKNYPKAKQVKLPKVVPPGVVSTHRDFIGVLLSRRTHRRFAASSLTLEAVSQLLYYTWGFTGEVDSEAFGRLPARTSPSGGARHPIEAYLLATRVDGLPAGMYHYDGRRHRLERLRSGNFSRAAVKYCAGQKWVRQAGAVFLMTAVFPRSMWKYRIPRAYRVVLLDAGHLGQTFCLVATWLGLASFSTAALADTLIENDLGLNGVTESAIYVTAVGAPVTARRSNEGERLRT